MALEPRLDGSTLGDIQVQGEHPYKQPVHVHGRVPVVAAVKRRVKHAGAPFRIRPGQELVEAARVGALDRSEEHTSELQSLRHLVCRLLLEKKKHTESSSV